MIKAFIIVFFTTQIISAALKAFSHRKCFSLGRFNKANLKKTKNIQFLMMLDEHLKARIQVGCFVYLFLDEDIR